MMQKVQETALYKCLVNRKSGFLEQVNSVIKYAEDTLPLINKVFDNYTLHGVKHSINVMEHMSSLIADITVLSELEIVLLIYSALLHDIGMVAEDAEIAQIKEDKFVLGDRKYSKVLEKYGHEKIALQECIRPVHGRRSKEHIEKYMDEKLFLVPGSTSVSFRDELGLICESHNEDFEWIKIVLKNRCQKGHFDMNAQYVSLLLRIADYLDIDDQRAPMYLFGYLQPTGISELEWKQHFVVENYDKVIYNEATGLKEIVFQGTSRDPSIHRKLLKYFDLINEELKKAICLSESFVENKYLLLLKTSVINKIQTEGFNFSDWRLSLDYNAVTNLLMGERIYGNKKYGLRELIQNSIDACKTMEESSLYMNEYRYQKYQPLISIILDIDRKQVIVKDNGSGMSANILKRYFLNVGVSYYMSDDYLLQGKKYSPIGHYGIGFLACFMLSDKVEVKTVCYKEHKTNKISFEKNSEYICLTCENDSAQHGTEIILDLEQCLAVFDNDVKVVVDFIENNFLDVDVPINVSVIADGEINTMECELNKFENIIPDAICLNDYLDGIEAYIECNCKQIKFATKMSELVDGDANYHYNSERNFLDNEDSISIKDCVKDGKIEWLSIPVISEYDTSEFMKAYEILNDYEYALDIIGYYLKICIWSKEEDVLDYEGNIENENDKIIGEYTLSDFRKEFNHAKTVPVESEYNNINVVVGKENIVMPYDTSYEIWIKYGMDNLDVCFMNNILLCRQKMRIPYLVEGILLKGIAINIKNKKIIPDVSRHSIGDEEELLYYAVGKAIHLWIRDNISLKKEEKELLELFIEEKYGETNYLLK